MARIQRNKFTVYMENVKPPSELRIKLLILTHLLNSDSSNHEQLKSCAQLDIEWRRLCNVVLRYRNALQILKRLTDVELEMSAREFDFRKMLDSCRSHSLSLQKRTRGGIQKKLFVCFEPRLESDFIQKVVDDFFESSECASAVICIPVHSYLHRIWTKAAKSEIRPKLSGLSVNESICEDFDFACKCPRNYLLDVYTFKNHTLNFALDVELFYSQTLHKIAIRFIRLTFYKIPPLYTRKRPRQLTFDILFDVTTFLRRQDLDSCQLVSREWFNFIENNRNGFALHNFSSAKLVTKGDFFCFGVFDENDNGVKDFRERRCNAAVTSQLFYPLLRNTSVNRLYLKRIDLPGVFERFQQGIISCLPLHVHRLVFASADCREIERILMFTESTLKIREYEVDVFSQRFFERILLEAPVRRCHQLTLREQYTSRRNMLPAFLYNLPDQRALSSFKICPTKPQSTFFIDDIIREFKDVSNLEAFHNPVLLVLQTRPTELPRLCTNPVELNVNDCFAYETPTLCNVYHFKHTNSDCWLTMCLGSTSFHPIKRVCHFELGRRKMASPDKDFRFMATNDLMSELQKDSIKLDDDIERRITKAILHLLEDRNGEVQNLAVKCLAPLVSKIELVVESLCHNVEMDQERLRDVSSIALKTVVNELSPINHVNQVAAIIGKILPNLLNGLKNEKRPDASIKIEILDIVGIIINKFTRLGGIDFNSIEDVLFLQLTRERQALRKRAINVLGFLVEAVDEPTYEKIVDRVLELLKNETDSASTRAYVLAAATISKANPRLFAKRLEEFIEILLNFCKKDDDELKDACLHAFEIFISRCNREIVRFLPSIVDVCIQFIKYDPNYQYDSEDENGVDEEEMEVDGADDESDMEEYSDDDDMSWKVRRSATKCFEVMITSRSDQLVDHYVKIAPILLSRFKEREESVKIDVFRAYEALLKQTRLFLPESLAQLDAKLYHSVFNIDGPRQFVYSKEKFNHIIKEDVDRQQCDVLNALSEQVPQLIRSICKQLKSRSAKIRLQCFSLLISLLRALPGALETYFDSLMPAVKLSIQEKSSDCLTKMDTLQFLHISFCSHEPTVFLPQLDTLVPLITNSVNEPFYKIGSVSLLVLQSLIVILRHLHDTGHNVDKYIEQIYWVIIGKLKVNDIDQEVKERSIASTGILLSTFGSKLSGHLNEILPLLVDRLRNEMTRHIAVQTFAVIVGGIDEVDLSNVLQDLLMHLSEFLRKNQRGLRISTLSLLSALVTKYKLNALPDEGVKRVVHELPAIMIEQDMYISQLSIKLARDIISKFPNTMSGSLEAVISSCLQLIKLSSLIGRSLEYAVDLFGAVVASPIPQKPQFMNLVHVLMEVITSTEKPSRQVCLAVATILAHSTKANNDADATAVVLKDLINLLKNKKEREQMHVFALFALGEIGRSYPEAYEKSKLKPEDVIMESFNSSTEEVKTVASYALGSLATGNVSKYLPSLLNEIKTQPKSQYLLLHALKEIIASQNTKGEPSDVFKNVVNDIWTVLLNHSQAQEESTRNVVAECMGKLCRIEPMNFLPQLIKATKEGQHLERNTAATAVRFMIVDSSSRSADEYLHTHLAELLRGIEDEDMSVRRTSIMTLNSAAHNKPRWVKELLPTLLPALYRETVINKALVYEVEMGPFKHVVDDGLDLRKSAYECMYTLMEHCLDRLNILEYMNYIEQGLTDQHDIKLLNLLMLTRLAQTCTVQMSQRIDRFAELIIPLLHTKPRPNSVKQENDKLDELKRACIRTILALKRVPMLERSTKLVSAYELVRQDTNLKAMMEAIEKDNSLKLLHIGNDDAIMGEDF
ncbi:hypothetical protein M3Y98_00138100 [Aphelenchoides besseyi]|nr:hypothetical protein M3Y98_00138100 [Aphelenchoides besseyi]